jgi:CBS domain containing-hemolysin-like protein
MAVPGVALTAGVLVAEGGRSAGGLLVALVVILVFILINALFVAAEFGLIGVRPTQIEELALDGNRRAMQMHEVLDSPARQDRYIATAQLGITIASLGLGMYGEAELGQYIEPALESVLGDVVSISLLHSAGALTALLLLTYLHIVLGEMVPKSIALARPERTALWIMAPMNVAQRILSLPVRALNGIGRALLHVFRIPPAEGQARLHSPDEIELIVTESVEGGLIAEGEEEMIRNIFDFSDRQVGQVMTSRRKVQAIPVDIPADELLSVVTTSTHTRFPVYDQDLDHVLGILHLKDLVQQQLNGEGQFDIREILRPAPVVPEDQQVERLLAAFKRKRIHMAVVVDEFGGLAGVVTLEDLVEEVVGEVVDEFDVEREPVIEIRPGELDVAGTFLVADLQEYVFLGEEESLPDVETVGGLIHTWLGRPPKPGDVVTAPHNHELRLTVLDVDGLAVSRAKIDYPFGAADHAAGRTET